MAASPGLAATGVAPSARVELPEWLNKRSHVARRLEKPSQPSGAGGGVGLCLIYGLLARTRITRPNRPPCSDSSIVKPAWVRYASGSRIR